MKARAALGALAVAGLLVSGCSAREGSDAKSATFQGRIDVSSCPKDATAALAAGAPIKIGVTIAQSGPLAVLNNVLGGIRAAFAEVNDAGGIDGHRIEVVAKDDAFETSRAVANARELIEGDKVMALAGQVGTAGIGAVQQLVERNCVPQLWSSTGSDGLGANPDKHPWTTAQLLMYKAEAKLWIKAFEREVPQGGKIVVITNTDDRGKVYESAIKEAAQGTKYEVAAVHKVDLAATNVDPQVNATLGAKPDIVIAATDGNKCPLLFRSLRGAGYKGEIMAGNVCSSVKSHWAPAGAAANGAQVLSYVIDPGNPAQEDTPEVEAYRKQASKISGVDVDDSYTSQGYQIGMLLAANLKAAAKLPGGLSRANLMEAAWTTDAKIPLTPGGQAVRLDFDKDPYWRDTVQLMQYEDGVGLKPVGEPISLG